MINEATNPWANGMYSAYGSGVSVGRLWADYWMRGVAGGQGKELK